MRIDGPFFVAEAFFLVFFQCGYVCVRVVVVRFFETARGDGFNVVRGRPAGATRVRTRARVDATHASAPRSRIVWSYSSWSVRHRSTASDAGRGPGVDVADPIAGRSCRGPREQPQDGADDRTSRSIHRPRPFLSSSLGRSSRSEGGGGESVINRFAAVPSGLVRGGVGRVFARLLVSRRRRSYFSSSSSRRRRARCPSIGAPPRRPSSGVQVPNPVLSVCYI